MKMRYLIGMAILLVVGAGCGDDTGTARPAGVGQTVVTGNGETAIYDTPTGDDCIEIGSQCVSPQDECGDDARVDVIVDDSGEYVDTVCYPGDEITHDEHKGSIKSDEDGTVVVLDGKDDGADITDNVEFKGNDGVLYGQGEDVSVVRGNVKVIGNNAAIRGVRIEGSVDLEGNDGRLTNCVIEGNLHIKGNGNMVTNCIVFGDLKAGYADAQDTTLIGNYVQKDFRAEHETTVCSGNFEFSDKNENVQLDASEADDADAVSCPTESDAQ
ncbi:hypothetical protein FIV42_17050 [Persicimonas caeni]|uniref:Right-handed parallel beta-helix repeat-containing protein n=1 Tax=Persicimonas caeni TaxID=2292766 RepID=A0A4Y6PVM2_PERCE|nr:hypothetical protein [Persicimonas caeni]QDG52386.1 hypothetical protein FIV42_17050 [Persicimonas caeni]QED33608.1 hypothetical protein FRD00_17045 [Persicimonas caeni]